MQWWKNRKRAIFIYYYLFDPRSIVYSRLCEYKRPYFRKVMVRNLWFPANAIDHRFLLQPMVHHCRPFVWKFIIKTKACKIYSIKSTWQVSFPLFVAPAQTCNSSSMPSLGKVYAQSLWVRTGRGTWSLYTLLSSPALIKFFFIKNKLEKFNPKN